jgi:hypothetical protein
MTGRSDPSANRSNRTQALDDPANRLAYPPGAEARLSFYSSTRRNMASRESAIDRSRSNVRCW